MATQIYSGELQDHEGNTLYPHTEADVVFLTSGETVQEKIIELEEATGNSGSGNSELSEKVTQLETQLNTLKSTTATTSANGLMSSTDKTKLNGIAENANNYSLPEASPTVLGGVKIGYAQNGKNYPVQLSDGKMYVNVPWADNNTTYQEASQSTAGLMSASDKKKLDGIDTTLFLKFVKDK